MSKGYDMHRSIRGALAALGGGAVLMLSACSSTVSVPYKVNAEPEGSFLLIKMDSAEKKAPGISEWIYLGATPIEGIRSFDSDDLEEMDRITLKVVHSGYVDQIKEWDGEGFWQEAQSKGRIYWAPELIPQSGN